MPPPPSQVVCMALACVYGMPPPPPLPSYVPGTTLPASIPVSSQAASSLLPCLVEFSTARLD